MTRILSRPPRWDILEKFYRVFDKGRKRDCVEQWQKEMPKSLLEQELFETQIHIEFLTDRREKLNKEFRWTFANMKKLITMDQRIRELNNEISRIFNSTKKDIAGLVTQKHEWYKEYELEAEICPANDWSIAGEHEYISDLLFWYVNWDAINILANTNEDHHERHKAYNVPAWKQMMLIDKFVEGGVTWELDALLYDTDASLYSFKDIVRFRPEQFEVRYKLSF
ncbi:MAG: hypothetical protein J5534_00820 [Fibrobacter sp.]|nr:hypothetical protein [Fibrobacter sp.]